MLEPQPWGILAVALVGNVGFWIYCFNRINATGLARRATKRIEKIFVVACFLLPALLAWQEGAAVLTWLMDGNSWWPGNAPWFCRYASWCIATVCVLAPAWIESRCWLIPPKHVLSKKRTRWNVHRELKHGSPGNRSTQWLMKLPANEIGLLDVTEKELQLPRPIDGFDRFRIGHLSDLHFTGQLRKEHYEFVFERFLELRPDLIVVAGDIIDYPRCIEWLEPLMGRLEAAHGVVYVLGNHDRRLKELQPVTGALDAVGMVDLGARDHVIEISAGSRIELFGNERPWLNRHSTGRPAKASKELNPTAQRKDTLRLAVCHTPDQIEWARSIGADLALAGHTHGGQVRFPGIGPVVSPSWYGSRFASGVFYVAPTLMHVSRGVAGTHPLRWRCAPEISCLTLSNP